MILEHDDDCKFAYQLTYGFKRKSRLSFALEHFETSLGRHCIIKKDKLSNEYAVFIDNMVSESTRGKIKRCWKIV